MGRQTEDPIASLTSITFTQRGEDNSNSSKHLRDDEKSSYLGITMLAPREAEQCLCPPSSRSATDPHSIHVPHKPVPFNNPVSCNEALFFFAFSPTLFDYQRFNTLLLLEENKKFLTWMRLSPFCLSVVFFLPPPNSSLRSDDDPKLSLLRRKDRPARQKEV